LKKGKQTPFINAMNATESQKQETATELYKRSFVNKDRIWKDYIQKSEFAANKWPENWGFLAGKLENVKYITFKCSFIHTTSQHIFFKIFILS
jgi:hypothetical protein